MQIVRFLERFYILENYNSTLSRSFFQAIIFLICSSFSDTAEFVITFTVHLSRDNSEVDSIIDLRTPVYGKVMITDDAGVPEYLDVHLRQVVADTDNTTGGDDEYLLIENG